ncbi:hypothetical protein JOD54_003136 [Actinokineospora baliensis]|uniref:hypothetical protein n=1 Tax=Actinokineospora baliensis TaxID=547056 RepID=UPI00195776E1|nr:hypothetical protein [Actinokineospora baliensis]MBM7772932.1 hypothetical protein [Actinokineospora baliensis]
MYYKLDPEVPGGIGELSELDTGVAPLVVRRLHYEFDSWFGDCLGQSSPIYILAKYAAVDLERHGFSGFNLREVLVTRSEVWEQLDLKITLPQFVWLDVVGVGGQHDIGRVDKAGLVVSSTVLDVLKSHRLDHCKIVEFPG